MTPEIPPEKPSHPLAEPQAARAAIRIGHGFVMEAEARATPVGLLAVGGLVAAILLSIVPIVRAKRAGRTMQPLPDEARRATKVR
jgi:hypothetical protein